VNFVLNFPRPSFVQEIMGTISEVDPFRVSLKRLLASGFNSPITQLTSKDSILKMMKIYAEGKHHVVVTCPKGTAGVRAKKEMADETPKKKPSKKEEEVEEHYYNADDDWLLLGQNALINFLANSLHDDWFPSLWNARVIDLNMIISKYVFCLFVLFFLFF
jgi:hypothetical protein